MTEAMTSSINLFCIHIDFQENCLKKIAKILNVTTFFNIYPIISYIIFFTFLSENVCFSL